MEGKHVVAKLEADKAATEMELWRKLENDNLLATSWPIAISLIATMGFLVLGDIPRPSQQMMLFVLLLLSAQFSAVQQRLAAITKLMKIHLMNR